VKVEYLDLTDYLAISAEVTALDVETITRVTKLDVADSALHAPAAGWGDEDLYPEFVDKAAVLVVRLAKNHPLPDGNKRAAWVSLRVFIEINGWTWTDYPAVDESERLMIAVASSELDEAEVSVACSATTADEVIRGVVPLFAAAALCRKPEATREARHRRYGVTGPLRSLAAADARRIIRSARDDAASAGPSTGCSG